MPGFGLDQGDEMKVWELAFAKAGAAGYLSTARRNREAQPLAATAYAAGFMGGAFLGGLPTWIDNALESDVRNWIAEGYAASQVLCAEYVGRAYEANRGDVPSSGGLSVIITLCPTTQVIPDDGLVTMVVDAGATERWRPVLFYPGAFVSDQGRVRDWKDFRKPRISRSHVYPHVEIPYGGAKKVHEVVAETWLGPRPDGMFICHCNDNKLDARTANLRYDTPAANNRDRIRNRRRVRLS
jgi:hypothetical protein